MNADDRELHESAEKHFNDELSENFEAKAVLDKFLKMKKEETDDGSNKRFIFSYQDLLHEKNPN